MPVGEPYIPYNITVHLGTPSSSAENVTVRFDDYIKNVASSEIYPTWNESAIRANVYAQISYALNRIYSEYYRSRGYNFDITNNTAIDQKFINNRDIFENVDRIVSEIFNIYISRVGKVEPLAAKYCNGTTVTCDGMSQWGSQSLAENGYASIDILKNYYGDDIELVYNAPMRDISESYPGTALRRGSSGRNVAIIQTELNRISQNYPAIPKIYPVDGVFGEGTEKAVKEFQSIFDLTPDGVVGKSSWYKMVFLYTGIIRLSELDSEGSRLFNVSLEYPDAVAEGDKGEKVEITQYFLSLISAFYDEVLPAPITGSFEARTKASVVSFQKRFSLPQTGIVDAETWGVMYDVFKGIYDRVLVNEEIFPVAVKYYAGETLKFGATGDDVLALQEYLNAISLVYTSITPVVPTGVFGKRTEQAVARYRRLFYPPAVGEVDRGVWNSIINTYKNVLAPNTPRPVQYPGRELKVGQKDN